MLNYFLKLAINSWVPKRNCDIVTYLYDKEVYPQYLITRSNFNLAIKNRLLNREDILSIKKMINKSLFKRRHYKDYRYKHYKNDAHEIYTKLKCKYLSKKQLKCLDKYITKIVKSKQCTTTNSTFQISQP